MMQFLTNTFVQREDVPFRHLYVDTICDIQENIQRLYIPLIGEVELDENNLPTNGNMAMGHKLTPTIMAYSDENPEEQGYAWIGLVTTPRSPMPRIIINYAKSTRQPLWIKRSIGRLQSSIAFLFFAETPEDKLVFTTETSGEWTFSTSLVQRIKSMG